MEKPDIKKFSLSEVANNSANGKTSAGKSIGIYLSIVGSIMLLYSTFFIRDAAVLAPILLSGTSVITVGGGLILGKILRPTKSYIIDEESDNK